MNSRMVLDLAIRDRDLRGASMIVATKEIHQIRYLANHFATVPRGGVAVIRQGRKEDVPDIRVMSLDAGGIGFFGLADDFFASSRPIVRNFIDPRGAENFARLAHKE